MDAKKLFDFKDRVVVITGAATGLGRQMTLAFSQLGATTVIMSRRLEKLENVKKEVEKLNPNAKCLPLKCDVTKTEDVDNCAKVVKEKFGKVDVLVNNAGSGLVGDIFSTTDEVWNTVINTNITGVFKATRAFGKIMKEKNYGRIINIASMYGLVGNTSIPCIAYHSSKGACINFTKAAAAELSKFNITVNCICPGYFLSEMTEGAFKDDGFMKMLKNKCSFTKRRKRRRIEFSCFIFCF
jgi:gluconate 5-dehydrogenase